MEQIFYPADILLPDKDTDMTRWSVIACDQFTSEPDYWKEVEQIVGEAPSALRLILPEVYLESVDVEIRLCKIRAAMEEYTSKGLLVTYPQSVIYIERTDSTGKLRQGVIGAIDLEQYDYHKGSTSPVRATEGTIEDRIPPRLQVRENGSIEIPHIMLLIDDREKRVIEKLGSRTADMEMVYDFDLMKEGGHLRGWLLDHETQKQVLDDFKALADETGEDENALVFAVGDGNHSLATAKEYYERLKKSHPEKDFSSHPARFALAEIVNLHSPALEFEAIHRIVTDVNTDDLFAHMTKALGLVRDHNPEPGSRSGEEVQQSMTIVLKGQEEKVIITRPTSKLTVGTLQNFLNDYVREHAEQKDIKVDYIHGYDNLKALTWQNGSMGFILPTIAKEELFPSVKADGALPRKTFSMGHAEDKRYYTECKSIR